VEENLVLFEEVAAYRLRQVTDELKSYAEWPALQSDGVKLLYSVFLALRLSRRAIASLLDRQSLQHLLTTGAIDQPELVALKRAGGLRDKE
jgi:hypothetical protein